MTTSCNVCTESSDRPRDVPGASFARVRGRSVTRCYAPFYLQSGYKAGLGCRGFPTAPRCSRKSASSAQSTSPRTGTAPPPVPCQFPDLCPQTRLLLRRLPERGSLVLLLVQCPLQSQHRLRRRRRRRPRPRPRLRPQNVCGPHLRLRRRRRLWHRRRRLLVQVLHLRPLLRTPALWHEQPLHRAQAAAPPPLLHLRRGPRARRPPQRTPHVSPRHERRRRRQVLL